MTDDEHLQACKRMLAEQIVARGVSTPRLLAAMRAVPRHCFVSTRDMDWAYSDCPLPIGYGQTISQPFIVALMTDLLELAGEERVLEIGTGSGYQAAVLGKLAAEVHTMEAIPQLAEEAAGRLAGLGCTNVCVHIGDGSLGWPQSAPYHGILVAAAAPEAPQPLLDQLLDGGRLVIPVGSRGYQKLEVWRRTGAKFERRVDIPVAFVPLRGEHGWR